MKWFTKIKTSVQESSRRIRLANNLPFILFLTLLTILSIRAGHSIDEKVHEISKKKKKLKELQAEYIESKSKLQQLGMESQVIEKANELGLIESKTPPSKIVVEVD